MCEENWCAGDFRYRFEKLECAASQCTLTFTARHDGSRLDGQVGFAFDEPLVDEYGDMDPSYWERVTDALADWEEAHR